MSFGFSRYFDSRYFFQSLKSSLHFSNRDRLLEVGLFYDPEPILWQIDHTFPFPLFDLCEIGVIFKESVAPGQKLVVQGLIDAAQM